MATPRSKQIAPVLAIAEAPIAKTLIEQVYHEIKGKIISGQLRPGSKLLIDGLRAQQSVSSSTIREALLLLVADALVTSEGQRGFRVAPISIEEFREIINLRKMMETTALRESLQTGDDNWESGVVASLHKLNLIDTRGSSKAPAVVREWSARNHAFHEALLAASTSRWVRHFRRILYQCSERYRMLTLDVVDIRPGVRQEHKAIMDAALARDADVACRLLGEHIERTFASFSKVAAELLPRQGENAAMIETTQTKRR